MSGNTSSSPSARSLGYIASVSADGVTASPTVVNVYVDVGNGVQYSPINAQQSNAVNFEVSPGITDANKKQYNYVSQIPKSTGKYKFDTLTPNANASTSVQKIGSPAKLTTSNAVSTSVKYSDVHLLNLARFDGKSAVTSGNKNQLVVPAAPQDPNKYSWNLPPHSWSMPRAPHSDPANMPANSNKSGYSDRYRRGRIWWKSTDSALQTTDGNGKIVSIDNSDRQYGFQFLWNPASFSTAVSVQMDATPNVNDRFLGTVGAFPATETVSFQIEVNRINDFACANAYFKRPTNVMSSANNAFISNADVSRFIQYYNTKGSFSAAASGATTEAKLVDLFQRGTLADIEYLYKSINGPGPGSAASSKDFWKNGRGIITADIGFLMPTLLNIDVGPLSYMGYVTSLSVNHTMFTEDMIPIQSTLNISLNLLATAGLSGTTTGA